VQGRLQYQMGRKLLLPNANTT